MNIFEIQNKKDKWYVNWSHTYFKKTGVKYKLLDILFTQVKVDEIGLSIMLHGGEYDTLYITFPEWAQDRSKSYSEYIADMYDISGVVLKNKQDAEKLQDILSKLYIWKELTT